MRVLFGSFGVAVDIVAAVAGAVFAILAEALFQFVEVVGFRAEMAGGAPVGLVGPFDGQAKLVACHAVEAVAFDKSGIDFLAPENMFEGPLDRRGTGTRRAGDGDDGMFSGHAFLLESSGLLKG